MKPLQAFLDHPEILPYSPLQRSKFQTLNLFGHIPRFRRYENISPSIETVRGL
jgi:hypothetical protein